jgi:uncharacterized protein (TIGR03790 family)
MKRPVTAQLYGALAYLIAAAVPARADILPEQVLVVYNSQSADALDVTDAYLLAHPDIPSANIFDLNDATIANTADISYSDFVGKIRNPIRSFINASGAPAPADIVSIVLIHGIPHRILDTDKPTAGDYPNQQADEVNAGDATAASVDADLVLLWQALDSGEAGGRMDSLSDNMIDNPYHQSSASIQSFSRSNISRAKSFSNLGDFAWQTNTSPPSSRLTPGDMYLVCRIDGTTSANAVAAINRAQGIMVNQRYVLTILDEDGRSNQLDDDAVFSPPVFNAGNDYEEARDALQADGWLVDYDATSLFITGDDQWGPVIAYAGYGENHSPGPSGAGIYIDGFILTPGAIFNTIESYNGRAFNGLGAPPCCPSVASCCQEQVADFIAAGGTFGIGQVWEPFSFSVPDNEFLFVNFLVNGLTWAEAAYSSIPALSWSQIVVGDPLARVELVVDQPADFEGDGDVDQADFGLFQQCLTGALIPQTYPPCLIADLDGDGDVDLSDFGGLQRCYSGPEILGDPDCLE